MAVIYTTVLGDLAGKLVVDADADNNGEANITTGTGSLYMVEIDATAGVATTSEPA
tara:strand:+ start:396 stop:563 length:168 start_codon:yes stop_codon:yes gene_type:complete